MPITYEVDRETRLLVTHIDGSITAKDLLEYIDAIISDDATTGCDELMIVGDADADAIAASDVRAAARRATDMSSADDGFRCAVVAARDADFGLFRMFQVFRDLGEERMAVFRTVDQACEWLGVKVP